MPMRRCYYPDLFKQWAAGPDASWFDNLSSRLQHTIHAIECVAKASDEHARLRTYFTDEVHQQLPAINSVVMLRDVIARVDMKAVMKYRYVGKVSVDRLRVALGLPSQLKEAPPKPKVHVMMLRAEFATAASKASVKSLIGEGKTEWTLLGPDGSKNPVEFTW